MKIRNLNQISLRNDPINCRMHGFSFRVSEDEVWSSRCEFFFLFRSEFDFKGSVGAKMHQDYKETNGTWNDEVKKSILMKIHGRVLLSRRTEFKEADSIVAIGWRDSSRSAVAIRRRFANCRSPLMTVGSRTEGQDAISSCEEGNARLPVIHRILIGRSWLDLRSIGCFECGPLLFPWWRARLISLKPDLEHVLQLRSGGSRVHCIDPHDSSKIPSDAPKHATHPVINENKGNSPTPKKFLELVG